MSREASLIFFGIRFEIGEDEITSVENRSHPIVSRARSVGLQVYCERNDVLQSVEPNTEKKPLIPD